MVLRNTITINSMIQQYSEHVGLTTVSSDILT